MFTLMTRKRDFSTYRLCARISVNAHTDEISCNLEMSGFVPLYSEANQTKIQTSCAARIQGHRRSECSSDYFI